MLVIRRKNIKKQITTLTIAITAFAIGMGFNNIAMSNIPANYKVAVVDLNTVVSKSAQVKALKKEQQTKLQELQKWIETVRADVAKQSTQESKEKLVKKYDAEFAKKQETIKKNYAMKLQAIDKSITATIAQEAKAQNYNLVLSKSSVLYGGDDITASIAKNVK